MNAACWGSTKDSELLEMLFTGVFESFLDDFPDLGIHSHPVLWWELIISYYCIFQFIPPTSNFTVSAWHQLWPCVDWEITFDPSQTQNQVSSVTQWRYLTIALESRHREPCSIPGRFFVIYTKSYLYRASVIESINSQVLTLSSNHAPVSKIYLDFRSNHVDQVSSELCIVLINNNANAKAETRLTV